MTEILDWARKRCGDGSITRTLDEMLTSANPDDRRWAVQVGMSYGVGLPGKRPEFPVPLSPEVSDLVRLAVARAREEVEAPEPAPTPRKALIGPAPQPEPQEGEPAPPTTTHATHTAAGEVGPAADPRIEEAMRQWRRDHGREERKPS